MFKVKNLPCLMVAMTMNTMLLINFEVHGQSNKDVKYLSSKLSVSQRIKDLMSRMTLEEKVGQMCQYVGLEHIKRAEKNLTLEEMRKSDAQGYYPGLFSMDVAKMTADGKIGSFLHVVTAKEANYLQELAQKSRLKIPLLIGIDAIHGNGLYRGATVYPSPISQAATWDDALIEKGSFQTALEQRATGSHWSFTPNIDVLRDPRWGRTGETFGEDPYLVGNMGVATIKGLQSDAFSGFQNVIACAKHLVAGSQSINGLNAAPTDVSNRTLMEVFMPPYKRAITEANVFSVMLAHNEVGGIPAHMDKTLMTDLLRDRWGFEGFYVSDWNDVERIHSWHRVAQDFKEASFLSVDAGMDMHMHGPEFMEHVIELVKEGKLSEDRINESCRKILEVKFKLGLFENPFVNPDEIDGVVFAKEHQQTALEQARKAVVLQKNNGILPLGKGNGKKIFITGPNANNQTILGDWAAPQPEDNVTTIFEGVKALGEKKGYEVSYFDSGQRSRDMKDEDIVTASDLAGQADITILVLGENSFRHDWSNKTTGENMARATLKLSGKQKKLADRILTHGKPVIMVYVSGSPIAEPELEKSAAAVLNTWEPGCFGGQAAAEIIFGLVNPSGKLPLTIPRSVGQLQMVYNHKPSAYVHKYRSEKYTPLYPFGFGLSYTTYKYGAPTLSTNKLTVDGNVKVSVQVKNTGNIAGEEIVQLYVRDNFSSVTRPVKELKGYKRVFLEPGESKVVSFGIIPEILAFYDREMKYVVEPGDFTIMVGSSSSDNDLKSVSLKVEKKINLED
ncbi:glycoside hydrolase family 3 N-terminal domain-containing protein [Flagellimonas sp. 2504JD4-2]